MTELSKVIVFQLKEQQYGVNIQQVLSIEKLQRITDVPETSDFIKGVVNLRDKITPIIDLRERLKIGDTNFTDETRILIVQLANIQIGLIVDSATDVIDVDAAIIEPATYIVKDVDGSFLKGVAKLESSLLLLLDLEYILNIDEIHAVEQAMNRVSEEDLSD